MDLKSQPAAFVLPGSEVAVGCFGIKTDGFPCVPDGHGEIIRNGDQVIPFVHCFDIKVWKTRPRFFHGASEAFPVHRISEGEDDSHDALVLRHRKIEKRFIVFRHGCPPQIQIVASLNEVK
jgi:hypothetical protein